MWLLISSKSLLQRINKRPESKWPDDIYQRWAGRFESSDLPSFTDIVVASERAITRHLRQRIGNAKLTMFQRLLSRTFGKCSSVIVTLL